MSLGSLLNISKLGIFASQGSLQTISHNISNVNTPGFSRQSAALESMPGHQSGIGGSGVRIGEVRQQLDELVDRRLELGTGELGRLETKDKYLQMVENVFNEMDGDGLAKRLEAFYDAADTLGDNPGNAVARYQVVAKADGVAKQINAMHGELSEIALPIDKEIGVVLTDINTRLKSIQEISNTIARNNVSNPALDLKDQRRQMILELGKLIDIRTMDLQNGDIQIMTSKEQELLADSVFSATLSRSSETTNSGFSGIKIGERPMDMSVTRGGQLGGLLELRDQVIHGPQGFLTRLESLTDEIRFQVNQAHSLSVNKDMASSLTGVMNVSSVDPDTALSDLVSYSTSASGMLKAIESATDLNTLISGALVKTGALASRRTDVANAIATGVANNDTTDQVVANAILADQDGQLSEEEARVIVVAAKVVNGGGLIADAYSKVKNGQKTPDDLRRVQDGTIIFATGSNGDNLQPKTAVSITRSMTLNQIVEALNGAGTGVTAAITNNQLQISTTGGKLAIISDQTGLLAALGVGAMFSGRGAADMAVNGSLLADPDLVGVGRLNVDDLENPTAVTFDDANSQGALALGNLRTAKFSLFNNNATLTGHYATLVGEMGSMSSQNKETLTAQQSSQSFISDMRESISGVSLEEELTDLIRFQRAFQASSKMVGVADELMQSIIQMV